MIKRAKKIFAYAMIGTMLSASMVSGADALSNTTSYNTYLQQYFNKYYSNYRITTVKQPTTNTTTTTQQSPTPTTNNTTNTTAPTSTQTTSGEFSAYQQEVLNIVNKERASRGLSALKFNAEVAKVATTKSQDMIDNNYFDHNSPTYGSPFDMMKKFGISYRTAGENIAMGQKTPQEVMTAWMNSDGHRKNILNSSFTEIGIGIAKDSNGRLYWTQMFIGR